MTILILALPTTKAIINEKFWRKRPLKMEKNDRKDPNVEYHLWSTEFMCIILLIFTLIIHLFFFLFLYRKSEAQEI